MIDNVDKIRDWIGLGDSSNPYSLLGISPDESNPSVIHDTFLALYGQARNYQNFDTHASTQVQEEILAAYEKVMKSLAGTPDSPDLPDPEDVPELEEIDTDGPVNVEIDDLPVASPYQPSESVDIPLEDFEPPSPVEPPRPRFAPQPEFDAETPVAGLEDTVPEAVAVAEPYVERDENGIPYATAFAEPMADYSEDGLPYATPFAEPVTEEVSVEPVVSEQDKEDVDSGSLQPDDPLDADIATDGVETLEEERFASRILQESPDDLTVGNDSEATLGDILTVLEEIRDLLQDGGRTSQPDDSFKPGQKNIFKHLQSDVKDLRDLFNW